jgi:CubicO group peptidase (beta-lactamase class C family)
MTARRFGRLGRLVGAGAAAAMLAIALVPGPVQAAARSAPPAPPPVARSAQRAGPDPAKLRATLDATHEAGMIGLYSSVRDGDQRWEAASGVADVRTGRSVRPDMKHRVGSITKTFVAAAVLQQVEQGRIQLDAPIGRYLPEEVPGERGQAITVRMLLNHTSGIGDYIPAAFPSLRNLSPEQLIKWGLEAVPDSSRPTNAPGTRWSYSNTNYVIAGRLLEKVTGVDAETHITRNVIRRAGLKHTYFPDDPEIRGDHSRMYESLYGNIRPPRDYSRYDMSWAGTAGALVSTMDDLNRFYRSLLTGKIIGADALAEMRRTVPVKDADGNVLMNYGLGLHSVNLPCGAFWGHDGVVFGAGTQSLAGEGGGQQISVGLNLTKYQTLNGEGRPIPHPIDNALGAHLVQALCGDQGPSATATVGQRVQPLPLRFQVARP